MTPRRIVVLGMSGAGKSTLSRALAALVGGPHVEPVWHRADLLVWLDQPLRVVVPRLLRRSLGRIVRRTELWNGNREGLNALVGRDSVIAWAIRQHRSHRTAHPARPAGLPHLRLRSTAEADRRPTTFGEAVRRGPGPTPP
ncbi:hypothetical protein ACFFSW_02660 [Saccharothrix longispora]|uniref:ABC-type iron transport system FetAB ATPase subunit n=1 Tax=Saccharothrix longispora TaxID=33920 RepID=A0ABU1PW83_9PSEU|nr:hypothetical protein [Saccharothrix longispora]MDR6594889.1 ABC-type iron transport system FetAB ATPase subunit [Saccharothrix longispora]